MMSKVHFGLAGVISTVLLAACGGGEISEPLSSVPGEQSEAVTFTALERRLLEYGGNISFCDANLNGDQEDTCSLFLDGEAVLIFETERGEALDEWGEAADLLTVTIISMAGETEQVFEEVVGRTFEGASLEDVGGDGALELLIPTYTGNVNTTWRVWQQIDGRFHFAGEVSGFGLRYDGETGFTAVTNRGSAVTYFYEAYHLNETGFSWAYTLGSDIHEMRCSFEEGPAFSESTRSAADIIAACEAGMGEE